MFQYLLLSILLLFFPLSAENSLSIVSVFKNETRILKEWMVYHHKIMKIDHFYLYNNESSDNYLEILQPYIDQGIVTLKDWPTCERAGAQGPTLWRRTQNAAIDDALAIAKEDGHYWMAILDSDEFILTKKEDSIKEFLKPYEKLQNLGSLILKWEVFGSSGLEQLPDSALFTESFTKRAKSHLTSPVSADGRIDLKAGRTLVSKSPSLQFVRDYKAIVRLSAVDPSLRTTNPHFAYLTKGYRFQYIPLSKAQINHYFTRNEEWFIENKRSRKALQSNLPCMPLLAIKQLFALTNRETDLSMQRFVPQLKEAMFHDLPSP